MPSNSVSHPCRTGPGRLHRALAREQEVRRVVEHPRDGDLHQRAPVHGRMQVRPESVHHVRGIIEALGGDEVERVRRELPGRRAIADGSAPREGSQHVEALLQDRLLAPALEVGDALVHVSVAADLVAVARDGPHARRIVLGDPRGNEEARADLGIAQHAQDAGQSLEDAEAPLRERHRLLDAAGEPERLGIEVERERAGGPGLPGPGGIGTGGRDIRHSGPHLSRWCRTRPDAFRAHGRRREPARFRGRSIAKVV